MNNSGYVQTKKSTDLVTFKIMVDGNELPAKYGVLSIVVEKEVNRIPYAKITLIDGNAPKQDFELSSEDLLIPGKKIEITAGYHSKEDTIFKGVVIKHNIKVRKAGSCLIVECKDEAVKMTVGRKSAYFYESTDANIIEQLVGDHGLTAEVEATNNTHQELVQYRASDWDFMITRHKPTENYVL